jgi:hypothetical protein
MGHYSEILEDFLTLGSIFWKLSYKILYKMCHTTLFLHFFYPCILLILRSKGRHNIGSLTIPAFFLFEKKAISLFFTRQEATRRVLPANPRNLWFSPSRRSSTLCHGMPKCGSRARNKILCTADARHQSAAPLRCTTRVQNQQLMMPVNQAVDDMANRA